MTSDPTPAALLGEFAANLTLADIPDVVLDRARHLVLDGVGIAFVSATHQFAETATTALTSLGPGDCPVIGTTHHMAARDAATLNGILVHGLDFDDTHSAAIAHVTACALPAALSAAWQLDASASDVLLGYILAVETTARIGIAARGQFHEVGYHATSVAGAFGAAVAASRIAGDSSEVIARAQGIVGSMASGVMEFLSDGSWTKRMHPGWAAAAGVTAQAFATAGWLGPTTIYEGRFGLFATHLGGRDADISSLTDGLGERWETMNVAVKPYPTCHFTHTFLDLVIDLTRANQIDPAGIDRLTCYIHPTMAAVVCEPANRKLLPQSDYDAKFSLQYLVAVAATRHRLVLSDLDEPSRTDPSILALAGRVEIRDDHDGLFPDAYSGAVELTLRDGRVLSDRAQLHRGHHDLPLTNQEISDKFTSNLGLVASPATATRVRDAVLKLGAPDGHASARDFAELLVADHTRH